MFQNQKNDGESCLIGDSHITKKTTVISEDEVRERLLASRREQQRQTILRHLKTSRGLSFA